ncbi:MAG: LysM peptidoglycan-binding domain-containing protein [Cyclobacteriaceae bacterium]|jgi:LysM repeat protein|nr:LysM peptidoglycan-binding domain-containing protein [Flammeovirgaceae bacterium]
MVKLLFIFFSWAPMDSDSLRLETIDGKQFIIHQVEAKETLYAISRRYNVPVTVILANNPSSDGGISVGKLLRVPYTPKSKPSSAGISHVVAQGETLYSIARQYNVSVDDLKKWNNLSNNEISLGQTLSIGKSAMVIESPPRLIEQQSVSSTHTVAAKETLYSLARQYNVTVQQLKEWNNLTSDELKLGTSLYVTQPKYSGTGQPASMTKPVVTTMQASLPINERMIGTEEVKEQGMAELMEGTEGNRKYLAQHKTIKPGTILKVKNLTTNQEVFVRISSVLSGSEADVVMRLSKSAYVQLGGVDGKMKIEVTSYK